MLTNQLAKAIANLRTSVVSISVCGLRRELVRFSRGMCWLGEGPDFLDGADADAIGFTEGPVDGAGFRHAHFGTMHEERDVRWIGVSVSDKAATILAFVD